jgi:hypothetical protein
MRNALHLSETSTTGTKSNKTAELASLGRLLAVPMKCSVPVSPSSVRPLPEPFCEDSDDLPWNVPRSIAWTTASSLGSRCRTNCSNSRMYAFRTGFSACVLRRHSRANVPEFLRRYAADLANQLRTVFTFLTVGDAQVSRIADGIVLLLRQDRAQPVCEAQIDEVVEAPCGCAIVPNGIKALDYVRASLQPPVCSLLRNRLVGGSVQRYRSRSCSRSRIVSWPNLRSSRFFTQRRTRNGSRSKNSTKSLGDFLPPLAERGPGQRFD